MNLSSDQINNIVNDLFTMPHDEALLRIGGMKVSDPDRKIILATYQARRAQPLQPEDTQAHSVNAPPPSGRAGERPRARFLKWFIPVASVAVVLVLAVLLVPRSAPPADQQTSAQSAPPAETSAAPSYTPIPVPSITVNPDSALIKYGPLEDGKSVKYVPDPAVAPFKITLPDDGNYYYFKLKDSNGGIAQTIFMHPNTSREFDVPQGTFDVYVACGKDWYGPLDAFGYSGSYGVLDTPFTFSVSGDYATGHEIILTPRQNGNLNTDSISYEDF